MKAPGTQLLDRAIAILDAVANGNEDGVTLTELVEATGLSVPTCHRILASLLAHGLLQRASKGKRYRLGPKMMVYGVKVARGPGLRSLAGVCLDRLREVTGETALLMVRDDLNSVCIDRRNSAYYIETLTGRIGGSVPLGVGPGSLAMLAFFDAEEREAIIAANAERYRAFVNVDETLVRERCRETREMGFSLDKGELINGVAGVAYPVRDMEGRVIASLGITFLSANVADELVASYQVLLKEAALSLQPQLNPLHGMGLRWS